MKTIIKTARIGVVVAADIEVVVDIITIIMTKVITLSSDNAAKVETIMGAIPNLTPTFIMIIIILRRHQCKVHSSSRSRKRPEA